MFCCVSLCVAYVTYVIYVVVSLYLLLYVCKRHKTKTQRHRTKEQPMQTTTQMQTKQHNDIYIHVSDKERQITTQPHRHKQRHPPPQQHNTERNPHKPPQTQNNDIEPNTQPQLSICCLWGFEGLFVLGGCNVSLFAKT